MGLEASSNFERLKPGCEYHVHWFLKSCTFLSLASDLYGKLPKSLFATRIIAGGILDHVILTRPCSEFKYV